MKQYARTIISLFALCSIVSACGGSPERSQETSDSNQKIIDGTAIDPAQSPQVVQILLGNIDGSVGACSGTVIGGNHVLTAGHCFPVTVVQAVVVVNGVQVPVTRAAVHPGYAVSQELGAVFNDVAVIETNADLGLPALAIVKNTPVEVEDTIGIYGYGLDNDGNLGTLRMGSMSVDSVTPNHIGSVFDDLSNTCNGDSGGPATLSVTDEAGNVVAVGVVGVTSTGSNLDCSQGDLSLFTNLQSDDVINFILSVAPEAVIY